MKDKKILIVGNSYALAKHLAKDVKEVFVVPGNHMMDDFALCVDLREDDIEGILNFVKKNEIDLTVATSEKSINADIAAIFQEVGFPIFAPTAISAEFAIKKSQGKRFLYKLHAPTPRFGIFEKQQLAIDYLKDAKYPLVLRTDTDEIECDRMMCPTFETAKTFTEDLFIRGEDKVIITEYAYGHTFTMYVVTDGYHAIPLTTVATSKFTEADCGGLLTSGCACYSPDFKVSEEIQKKLFKNVVLNALTTLESKGTPYVGILGVDAVVTGEDSYTVLEFRPFMQDVDMQAVLNGLDEDLIDLFEACANGFFADEYDDILTNDNQSVAVLVKSRKEGCVINNFDLIESEVSFINTTKNKYFEYISSKGNNFVLTACAKTLSRANKILKEDIEQVKFDGMKASTVKLI